MNFPADITGSVKIALAETQRTLYSDSTNGRWTGVIDYVNTYLPIN